MSINVVRLPKWNEKNSNSKIFFVNNTLCLRANPKNPFKLCNMRPDHETKIKCHLLRSPDSV